MHTFARSIGSWSVAALLVVGLSAGSAFAQQVENLGTERFWTPWKGSDATGVICYVSSQPQTALPANVNRDPIHFMVIHRKGLGTVNEVQTLVGYPLQAGSIPKVSIDGLDYDMVLDGSAAWLAVPPGQTPESVELGFVAAMKAGTEMVVRGTSQRGTNTTDTYSLLGITAALGKIDAACQ